MIVSGPVVQIVPRFAPTACGVGDYARLLAAELQRQQGLSSRFLVADEQWCASSTSEDGEVQRLERSANETWANLQGQPLAGFLVQYSGYGYARRGAPLWLIRTLRSLRVRFPRVPMITMFHEVAATGPVATSAFWLRPLQLYTARCLRVMSDMVMTNCEANGHALKALPGLKNQQMAIQPVFSNFGEHEGELWSKRVRCMVVFNSNFGGQEPAASVWQAISSAVASITGLEVMMIGRPVQVPSGLSFPVKQPGFLSADEISAILARSAFGYVFHGPLLLGKSGVFAAFAAHGVVPLIQTASEKLPDDLIAGRTYHALRHAPPAEDDIAYFEKIHRNVREWYLPHSLAATAEVYAGLLRRCLTAGGLM